MGRRWGGLGVVGACLVLVAVLGVAASDDDAEQETQVHVVFSPQRCTTRTKPGDVVRVAYQAHVGSLDGLMFDSSLAHAEPLTARLGAGDVIDGWEKGLADMCVGERRVVRVPPSQYGNAVYESVPVGATLVFKLELLGINE